MENAAYFRYWGKAEKDGERYHLLPYHCLDVAAVAHVWWQQSNIIRERFEATTALPQAKAYAWVLFFVTLHDLGKFDVRFQIKADIAYMLWSEFSNADRSQSNKYWHGDYSSYWVFYDLSSIFKWNDWLGDEEKWEAWQPWIYAVAGHHGVIQSSIYGNGPGADNHVIKHDKEARQSFICAMENIFLKPAGLSLDNDPPSCDQDFLAGFCSISDWLGSSQMNAQGEGRFTYENQRMSLHDYFSSRIPIAKQILKESGLYKSTSSNGGMKEIFPEYIPQLVQILVDELPIKPGLTIIEAPTGSGKTEAALAYASLLLAKRIAESIIFALPTQATANAMFDRLIEVTGKIFADSNLLLAHGKAQFNTRFINLQDVASKRSVQDIEYETEASMQCSQWLSQSRKRVFLGQIGVCTIDQVLISVLPVKHKFVRSFGLGKSVLIVDEVHAYDSYMYGLLDGVLGKQQQMKGSAILLSATLPQHQKESLISAWGGHVEKREPNEIYPLITHISQQALPKLFKLPEKERKKLDTSERQVYLDVVEHAALQFDDELLERVIQAANSEANVVIICNLVADAQSTAQRLIMMGATDIDLFHSRFRFRDRQRKEQAVLADYGKGQSHKQGGILVATQVVEQSLDLDFDWMLTQLCPIDLLFQRLGRLHRHDRIRPAGFESAQCTVIVTTNQDYALHKLIYGNKDAPNSRVLWRTEQILKQKSVLHFPSAYRPMIEKAYQETAWEDEPELIQEEYERFEQCQTATKATAWHLMLSSPNFEDSDSKAALLTRDGEMNLNVIPVMSIGKQRTLLDGRIISQIEEWQLAEELSMNTIPVPASWRRVLPAEEEGLIWLTMEQQLEGVWQAVQNKTKFTYTIENGLERKET